MKFSGPTEKKGIVKQRENERHKGVTGRVPYHVSNSYPPQFVTILGLFAITYANHIYCV